MKESAKRICASGRGYWSIVNNLKKLGVTTARARRMARYALEGKFLWEGKIEPIAKDDQL